MSEDWKTRIVTMTYVKQELMKLDEKGIWPHYFPELAANEDDLSKTEEALGCKIDPHYAEFLKMANGWKGFFQTVDLFGTKELSNPSIMQYVFSLLDSIEDSVIESTGFFRDDLIPFAATRFDRDLFVITRPTSRDQGTVIWFAGEEIDRYPNFTEYFLAMIDYNRLLVKQMQHN